MAQALITQDDWHYSKQRRQYSARKFIQEYHERQPRSLDNVSLKFQQYMDEVDKPHYRQAFKKIFDVDVNNELTQCICLGLGNFAVDIPGQRVESLKKWASTSLHQLAVLTVILKILRDKHKITDVYFQDPAFVKVEIEFLVSLGHQVIKDPAGMKKMSRSTFLFAPYLGYYVAADAWAVAFPALYLGNNPKKYLESLALGCGNPGGQDMIDVISRFQNSSFAGQLLPSFGERSWIDGLAVRWLDDKK